ncbi:DUF5916 domain-containing protein [Gillisia sp. Hel_I_86]|uniref:DUF5916 domain-containing protein n=1 Tax=Gillisia sp. Hel_I_86 TaxID=1249981 RepID=UPI0011A5A786|nr:DUF5916 domain-containing protein [Gillisia sp. Hel_I_86]
MKLPYLTFILITFCFNVNAQEAKKQLQIQRTQVAPKIDGILDDAAWATAEEAAGFIQFRPNINVRDTEGNKTVVKMTYDNSALYIAAHLYDDPSKISKQLSSRDNFGNSDFFGFIVNPNNDAQNDTEFFVFASGTQADAISNPSVGEDFGWNSVWSSAVEIVDDGWIVEMKIPYRCLRFDNDNVETWGIQFHRRFRRDESQYTWNPIDVSKGNIGLYHGELKGLSDLDPPTRLSLYPFISTVQNSFDGVYESNFNAGLDVKFGLTENFTLDATLIPDFSQTGFDNITLNLGPFEQTFSEQRQFFTEGVDLFSKGNLFFSRRVGGAPITDPVTSVNEEVVDYPESVKVLNAIKVSGRTKKGLGLGFFNSFTEKAEATIENIDTKERRLEVVEPFTNYNIIVVDQQFNGNSSIGIINTNVTRESSFRDANVTALTSDITNKRNTYQVRGDLKMSNLNLESGMETGFSSFFAARKAHGNFRYSIDHSYADTKYDPNDLGLQYRNNYNDFGIDINYRTFEPSGKWNRYFANFYVNYTRLANPSSFTGLGMGISANGTFKKLNQMGFNINLRPGKQYDYFEPRKAGSYFITENGVNVNGWWQSNNNKKVALSANIGTETFLENGRDYFDYWFGFGPRFRFNDKFTISYFFYRDHYLGDRGYVAQIGEEVIFGDRDRVEIEQTFNASYNFNPNNTLSLTLRNYWGTVDYEDQLFSLLDNGRVTNATGYTKTTIPDNPDINFTTWNFDLGYSWQFAPGSFVTALYRNQLFNFDTAARDSYTQSLDTLFEQPINHVFSLKLQYFLDYNQVSGLLKKQKS